MIKKTITNFGVKIDDRAYEISYTIENNDTSFIYLNLTLVAGIDYIDPDMSDKQGWCKPSNFISEVQTDTIICYIEVESIKNALMDYDYEIVDEQTMDLIKYFVKKNN
jgi:hypothetical protein